MTSKKFELWRLWVNKCNKLKQISGICVKVCLVYGS